MTKIKMSLFAIATLLGMTSVMLLSNQTASATGVVYACDNTPAGLVMCSCYDDQSGSGSVCVGSSVTLYWCTTTGTATCQANRQKQCPSAGTGKQAIGSCDSYQEPNQSSPCDGSKRNSCS